MTPLLISLVAVATVLYIGLPFYRGRGEGGEEARVSSQKLEWELQRESLLRELKELEFDHRMGKIDDAEYQTLRDETSQAASAVLAQLAALRPRRAALAAPIRESVAIANAIEIEVLVTRARRREKSAPQAAQSTLESNLSWRCACGRTMSHADRFCAACGRSRSEEVAGAESVVAP